MLKQEQVLQIEPQTELKFVGPFSQPVTSFMKLTNPSDKRVMFKIKTTAPKKYCVRPNSGVLQPGETTQIAICLQPFLYDPTEKNKHKFMVQTVFLPETGDVSVENLWKEVLPENLMDSKLKCVFEVPTQEQPSGATGGEVTATVHSVDNSDSKVDDHAKKPEKSQPSSEVNQLQKLESELRQEILLLKEEKMALMNQRGLAPNRYAPPEPRLEQSPSMMGLIFIAVVIGVMGILFGKFLL
ncbi:vesicle-associated membrane protein-associated protein B [Euwallacea similis]|uniref:vesicle-associated membrane protein-associated protein B n=1 Tax=Euwallacea similis TaxID=1736056 RepID=UPI00344E662D